MRRDGRYKKSKPLPRTPTMADIMRFMRLVRKGRKCPPNHATPCWYWQGAKDRDGYGRFKFAGTSQWAHRFSHQAFKGMLAPGHEAGHTCHRGHAGCVNPDHTVDQTKSENSREVRLREKANGHPGNGTKRKKKRVPCTEPVPFYDDIPF